MQKPEECGRTLFAYRVCGSQTFNNVHDLRGIVASELPQSGVDEPLEALQGGIAGDQLWDLGRLGAPVPLV